MLVARPGAEAIKAIGLGLEVAFVGRATTFELLLGQCDPARRDDLCVQIHDANPRGANRVDYRQMEPGISYERETELGEPSICFEYTPQSPSCHKIEILYAGEHIAGSPFQVLVQQDTKEDEPWSAL